MMVLKLLNTGIMDLLNPVRCCWCENLISHADNGICKLCLSELTGKTVHSNIIQEDEPGSNSMGNREWYLNECVSIHPYTGVMEKVIQSIKYDRIVSLVPVISNIMNEIICIKKWEIDGIVHIPMKRSKKARRGFNQSELLSNNISKISKIPCINILNEKSYSMIQKSLQINERFINVLGRFSIKPDNAVIKGRNLLLVDDVYTTGATLNECARVLKNHGADKVYAIVMGDTQRKKIE